MKKLNKKGMTTIEILVCFVLVAIITVSMYTTISAYNNKQHIESYKEKIVTFKNLITKDIQEDIIKKGLISAKVTRNAEQTYYSVSLKFRDGSTKSLNIVRVLASDYDTEASNCLTGVDDKFSISYGDGSDLEKAEEYPFPDLGESKNECDGIVKDFRINEVEVKTDNGVLSIYIGFNHPDLGNRYAIDIVSPINYDGDKLSGKMEGFADVTMPSTIVYRKNEMSGLPASSLNQWQTVPIKVKIGFSESTSVIEKYEIDYGCDGAVDSTQVPSGADNDYIKESDGSVKEFSNINSTVCVRAVDASGAVSSWAGPTILKVDTEFPTAEIKNITGDNVGTTRRTGDCHYRNNGRGGIKSGCYLDTIALEPSYSTPSSGIDHSNTKFVCATYKNGNTSEPWDVEIKRTATNGIQVTPNVPTSDPSIVRLSCELTVTSGAGNQSKKSIDLYFGNGWWLDSGGTGKWYYYGQAKMLTGWNNLFWYASVNPAGQYNWYYFNDGTETYEANRINGAGNKGQMATGWIKEVGGYHGWYYCSGGGSITAVDNFNWFPGGAALVNGTWTIGGSNYKFDSSGRCIQGSGCY